MKIIPALTTSQSKDLLSFHSSSKAGATQTLDPGNPDHKALIDTMLGAAGRTVGTYPHLLGFLNSATAKTAAKGTATAGSDDVRMVDAGMTASGKATAQVWSRSAGGSLLTGGSLMVFDGDSGALLAHGNNTTIQNGFVQCATDSATAATVQAGKKLAVLYVGHNTDQHGNARFFSYANTAVADNTGIQCNVTAPYSATNNPIQIAVGRNGGAPAGTDYIYLEPGGESGNAYLIAPFVGSVSLSGTIDIGSFTSADVTSSMYVVYNNTSPTVEVGIASAYTTPAKITAAFSVGGTPNVLQWNFPYDGPNNGYATTNSIVYTNGASLTNQLYSCFYFAFTNIPLQGGSVSPTFYVCSVNTPGESSINCTEISNLTYYYHCIAKGTLVTLEDGSTIPIEEVNERSRVKTGVTGAGRAVYATVLGQHSSDPASGQTDICRLTTANGKSIVLTESHMVYMSPDKCRLVAHLNAGDPIITDEGTSTISSIEAIKYDDIFYGLVLGSDLEQNAKNPADANFYAAGILCADETTMRNQSQADFRDLDFILPRIKPELHQDYTSAIQQQRS
jgi:Hint module